MSTSLTRNDRVTLRVKLPSYDESTDACRVSYVSLWTIREDLVSDDANEHPHRDTISTYFSIPEAGEYTGGVHEFVGAYQDGTEYMRVRHYQDGRDSDLELYDDTPFQTKDGRILGYAISTTTKCQGGVDRWPGVPKPVDQPSCAAVGNGNSWKLCKWVNYSVD